MGKCWKSFEKEVAEFFGGKRVIRVSYGESSPDVLHPTLAIECKYGNQVPKSLRVSAPTRFMSNGKPIIGFPAGELKKNNTVFEDCEKHCMKFCIDGLVQAMSYEECAGKLPVLCLKAPRMRGFVVVCSEGDYEKVKSAYSNRPLPAQEEQIQSLPVLEAPLDSQDHPLVTVSLHRT